MKVLIDLSTIDALVERARERWREADDMAGRLQQNCEELEQLRRALAEEHDVASVLPAPPRPDDATMLVLVTALWDASAGWGLAKIKAVKSLRMATALGLKEAKDFVEAKPELRTLVIESCTGGIDTDPTASAQQRAEWLAAEWAKIGCVIEWR